MESINGKGLDILMEEGLADEEEIIMATFKEKDNSITKLIREDLEKAAIPEEAKLSIAQICSAIESLNEENRFHAPFVTIFNTLLFAFCKNPWTIDIYTYLVLDAYKTIMAYDNETLHEVAKEALIESNKLLKEARNGRK